MSEKSIIELYEEGIKDSKDDSDTQSIDKSIDNKPTKKENKDTLDSKDKEKQEEPVKQESSSTDESKKVEPVKPVEPDVKQAEQPKDSAPDSKPAPVKEAVKSDKEEESEKSESIDNGKWPGGSRQVSGKGDTDVNVNDFTGRSGKVQEATNEDVKQDPTPTVSTAEQVVQAPADTAKVPTTDEMLSRCVTSVNKSAEFQKEQFGKQSEMLSKAVDSLSELNGLLKEVLSHVDKSSNKVATDAENTDKSLDTDKASEAAPAAKEAVLEKQQIEKSAKDGKEIEADSVATKNPSANTRAEEIAKSETPKDKEEEVESKDAEPKVNLSDEAFKSTSDFVNRQVEALDNGQLDSMQISELNDLSAAVTYNNGTDEDYKKYINFAKTGKLDD